MLKKFLVLLLCLFVVIVGCSKEEEKIDVTIETPKTIKANEEISITSLVTQGNEKLYDVDHVQFEIGKSGQKQTEKVNGIYKGKGLYSAQYTFKEEGTYTIISHVMVRGQMVMPQKEVTVEK